MPPTEPRMPLPALGIIEAGLGRVTETIAGRLAGGDATPVPDWDALDWRLAMAVVAAHGVAGLLDGPQAWPHDDWRAFLAAQREHVALRHARLAALLERIDRLGRERGIPLLALKGAALHRMGLYVAGERPMADIDLLVHPDHVDAAAGLLVELGYRESFVAWKHRVFHPEAAGAGPCLGEHRDTSINIELHTRIHERLPVAAVDITASVWPKAPQPGLNPYPSAGALMAHLLLHAAGNLCNRSLRLIHVHDLHLLAAQLRADDWNALWPEGDAAPWWAWPPLQMLMRYYDTPVPADVLARLRAACPPLLRAACRRQTLTYVSCSHLWLQALPGIEWSRSPGEALLRLWRRLRPTGESRDERVAMARTQLWLEGQRWVTRSHALRLLTRLWRRVPRMDTLYVVRQALASAPQD